MSNPEQVTLGWTLFIGALGYGAFFTTSISGVSTPPQSNSATSVPVPKAEAVAEFERQQRIASSGLAGCKVAQRRVCKGTENGLRMAVGGRR